MRCDGAQVRTRSERPATGYFVPPTVLAGLTSAATVAQTEIVGPVVTAL